MDNKNKSVESFSLHFEYEIIKFVEENPDYKKIQVAEYFGLKNLSTLEMILKNREEIQEWFKMYQKAGPTQRRIRPGNIIVLEEALSDWLKSDEGKRVEKNDLAICDKANELAQRYLRRDFHATVEWLESFRNRRGLLRKSVGEENSGSDTDVDGNSSEKELNSEQNECFTRRPEMKEKEEEIQKRVFNWLLANPKTYTVTTKGEYQVHTKWIGTIAAKANIIAIELACTPFHATTQWVDSFIRSHGFKWRDNFYLPDLTDVSVDHDILNLPVFITADLCDIFCVAETSLLFQLPPEKALELKKTKKYSDGEKDMERITILACANMDGTEKEPLVIVGKHKNPNCFAGIRYLPVTYESDEHAWLNSDIFASWLQNFEKKMRTQGRTVTLFLNSSSASVGPKISEIQKSLNAVTVHYLLPWNKKGVVSGVVNAMDLGIIKALKENYRKHQLWKILLFIKAGRPPPLLTLRHAITFLDISWRDISPRLVRNCFRKCGIQTKEAAFFRAIEDEDSHHEVKEIGIIVRTYCNFSGMNASFFETFASVEDHITVNKVDSKRDCKEEPDLDHIVSSVDTDPKPKVIEPWEASECLDKLRHFIQCAKDPPENILSRTKPIEDFIHKQGLQYIEQRMTKLGHVNRALDVIKTVEQPTAHNQVKQGTTVQQPTTHHQGEQEAIDQPKELKIVQIQSLAAKQCHLPPLKNTSTQQPILLNLLTDSKKGGINGAASYLTSSGNSTATEESKEETHSSGPVIVKCESLSKPDFFHVFSLSNKDIPDILDGRQKVISAGNQLMDKYQCRMTGVKEFLENQKSAHVSGQKATAVREFLKRRLDVENESSDEASLRSTKKPHNVNEQTSEETTKLVNKIFKGAEATELEIPGSGGSESSKCSFMLKSEENQVNYMRNTSKPLKTQQPECYGDYKPGMLMTEDQPNLHTFPDEEWKELFKSDRGHDYDDDMDAIKQEDHSFTNKQEDGPYTSKIKQENQPSEGHDQA